MHIEFRLYRAITLDAGAQMHQEITDSGHQLQLGAILANKRLGGCVNFTHRTACQAGPPAKQLHKSDKPTMQLEPQMDADKRR
jgi:hypothetical protein